MSEQGRPWLLSILALLAGGGVVAWNVSDFIGAEPQIRMTDQLNFLPRPEVAQAMAMGHAGTLSKLRLIDSYTFFSYVADSRDDSVAGDDSRGGFERLYETLIALDPNFKPFYLKAASSIGGLLGDHRVELKFLALGLDALPHDTDLWRYYVSVLTTAYDLENRQPEVLESLLNQWAKAELSKGAESRAWMAQDWMAAMSRRHERGIAQLQYWADQLLVALEQDPDGPQVAYLQERMREILTTHQLARLQSYWRAAGEPADWNLVLEPAIIAAVLPLAQAAGAAEPLSVVATGPGTPPTIALRSDPYGYPWTIDGDGPASTGQEHEFYRRLVAGANLGLRRAVRQEGAWPDDLAQAREWAGFQASAPTGFVLGFDGEHFLLEEEPEPPQDPWQTGDLLRAAGLRAEDLQGPPPE